MKPVGVKLATCIDYGVEHNEKHLKLKVANVRIFSKCYTPNWSEKVSDIKKTKMVVPWTYIIRNFNGEKCLPIFYGKV